MHELDFRETLYGQPAPLSIWIVNPFDDIPGEGLPALRYWTLARMLAARGHDVVWWTADFSHRRKARREMPRNFEEQESFRLRLVPVRPYAKNVSFARLRSQHDYGNGLERMGAAEVAAGTLDRPDLIVASMPPLEAGEAAVRLARRLDAAVVVDLMDLWPETFERVLPGPKWLRRLVAPMLLGGMYRRREKLLADADAIASSTRRFAEVAAPKSDVHVCLLGAYVEEFPPRSHSLPVEMPAATPQPTTIDRRPAPPGLGRPVECVYAGTLEAGQDLETIVAAARLLSHSGTPARIHVAGTGRLERFVESAAAAMPSGDSCRIVPHGLLDRKAYAELLCRCDVGLVAVKPETLVAVPYKAADFASAGLAIVNSLPGELADLVERYGAGLPYTAGDAASLARAIRELATDPRRLASAGRAARRMAETEFSREKIYGRYADWLEHAARP